MGIVGSVSVGDWGLWGFVTFGVLRVSGDVSVLVIFGVCASRVVRALGALSSGA